MTEEIFTAVYGHVLAHLGVPEDMDRRHTAPDATGPRRLVARVHPSGPLGPTVFATIGLSEQCTADGRRVEAVLSFRAEPGDGPATCAQEALHCFVDAMLAGATFEPGGSIEAGPVLGALGKTHLLLAPPAQFGPRFERLTTRSGDVVEFFRLVPVHEDEARFAAAKGPEALFNLLGAQGLDPTDLQRRSGAPRIG